MMPKMNPKDMEKMMQKMGIKQHEISASEVIIKTSEGNLIIKNPQVVKINMMGQDSFQIVGEITKEEFSEEDVKTVMDQADVSREKAVKALKESKGDLAEAILSLNNA